MEKNCPKENHVDILEVTKIRQGVGVCVHWGSYEIFIMAWRYWGIWWCSETILSVLNWDLRKQQAAIHYRSSGDKEKQEN